MANDRIFVALGAVVLAGLAAPPRGGAAEEATFRKVTIVDAKGKPVIVLDGEVGGIIVTGDGGGVGLSHLGLEVIGRDGRRSARGEATQERSTPTAPTGGLLSRSARSRRGEAVWSPSAGRPASPLYNSPRRSTAAGSTSPAPTGRSASRSVD